jgi:hypothetical protein
MQCYEPEDQTLNSHRQENLKTYVTSESVLQLQERWNEIQSLQATHLNPLKNEFLLSSI